MADDAPARQDRARIDWASAGCTQVEVLTTLEALPEDEVLERLGSPGRRETFRLGERQDEFHAQLQNTYPLSEQGNASVELQEWTWERGECRLTVWLHRVDGAWRVLGNLRWHRDTEF